MFCLKEQKNTIKKKRVMQDSANHCGYPPSIQNNNDTSEISRISGIFFNCIFLILEAVWSPSWQSFYIIDVEYRITLQSSRIQLVAVSYPAADDFETYLSRSRSMVTLITGDSSLSVSHKVTQRPSRYTKYRCLLRKKRKKQAQGRAAAGRSRHKSHGVIQY